MQCSSPAGQHLMLVLFPLGFAIIDKFSFVADLHRKIPKIPNKAAEPVLPWFKAGPLICEFLLAKNVLPSSVVNGEYSLVR